MNRSRVFAMALSFTCLLAAPAAFAGKHDDKDSDKEKKAPAKPSTTTSAPAPKPHSGPTGSTGSTSHSGTSSTTSTSDGSHSGSHSGSSHDSAGSGSSNSSHGSSTDDSSHTPRTSTSDSSHSHGSHDSSAVDSSHSSGDSSHVHGASSGDSSHVHGTHDSPVDASHSHSSSSYGHNSDDRSAYHRSVDHEKLHEAMRAHPGANDREHAFERSRAERVQFQRHVERIHFLPAHRVVLTNIRIVPTTYYYRRTVFYDTYGWRPRSYVFGFYPRYGLWDATFLFFALDHIAEEQYALLFYHHRHDEDFARWMDETDRLAEENADLRDELDVMRARMARLDESGLAVDPSYVPADAGDVALSPEVIDQLTKEK